MSVTIRDVEKVAQLAKLDFSHDQKVELARQLDEIVAYMEKLRELDTDDLQATFHVQDLDNVFRDDETKPSISQESALQNAPRVNRGYFSVPKAIG